MPLLAATIASLWLRRQTLSLADVFLLSIAMFFGTYTLIDIAVVELHGYDPVIAIALFGGIALGFAAIWAFARVGPRWVMKETSLTRFASDCIAAPGWLIVAMLTGIIVFRFYTTSLVEVAATEQQFSRVDDSLPYWFTTIGILAPSLLFICAVAAWAKGMQSSGKRKLFWFCLTAVAAGMIFPQGRRQLFAVLVVIAWMLATMGHMTTKRWVVLFIVGAIAAPFFIAISNVFTVYRWAFYRGSPALSMLEDESIGNLAEAAVDVANTVKNLEVRESMWRYNYDAMRAYLNDDGPLHWGTLLARSIPNYIPALLYPGDKEAFDAEVEMQHGLGIAEGDRAENIFIMTFGDFGFLGVIAAPLLIMLFIYITALILRRLHDPFLRILLVGMSLNYAMNLEVSYGTPLHLWRDFAVLALIYVLTRWALRFAGDVWTVVASRDHSSIPR